MNSNDLFQPILPVYLFIVLLVTSEPHMDEGKGGNGFRNNVLPRVQAYLFLVLSVDDESCIWDGFVHGNEKIILFWIRLQCLRWLIVGLGDFVGTCFFEPPM